MTRLSVPLSSTMAMATETWNSDRRSRRPSGSSAVAASANGKSLGATLLHCDASLSFQLLIRG